MQLFYAQDSNTASGVCVVFFGSMAEQIPYAVVANLINRLGSAAFREFGRIRGVMDELERLKNTIESIRVVLNDADEKQQQNRVVQHWIRRLKDEVLHPTDDMLDKFFFEDMRYKLDEASNNKVREILHSFTPNRIAFRLKMAHKIEKIQKKINDVVKDMAGLNLTPHVVVINQTDSVRRETGSFVLESDIVGREDNKNEIISLLRQPHRNTNVSLIAIVGIGGLGKTALAQLVYNDVEVQNLFEKRMWVCVSDNFDVKTIVKKMLESLVNGTIDDKLSLDNLQNKLRENLTGRRYLLVLDDMWNESHQKWTELRTYLMCGAQDSKVLVTTRSKTVAQTMGISTPYVLNGLNVEESWNLLKNIAFRDDTEDVTIQTLEPIGKKIAEKCRGVPLAIRTLGGLLMNTRENSEWSDVLLGEFWQLCEDEDSIMPVLRLSYQNLSPQMKQCFAYCSLFPKDLEIEKDHLIHMWMAQGYLEYSGEKQSMEDVGNQFVNIFLMKSFFQDVRMTNRGDLDRFKMHDLMHDLAMQVAGNDCCYLDSEQKKLVGRPMHVFLEGKAIGLLESFDASRVRTLILVHDSKDYPDIDISNFKKLRVLISVNCYLKKLSSSQSEINHLRYLKLCGCKTVGSFSKFISNLAFLQTLILKRGFSGHELSSKTFSKLINLRSVEISNWYSWEALNKKTIAGFEKYSMGRCSLTNIVEISLAHCYGLQYLPPLEHLPFLKSLTLFRCNSLEYIYFKEPLFPGTFFPSLESLMFWDCSLSEWVEITRDDVNDDTDPSQSPLFSFPRLSQLEIGGCGKLAGMPAFPNLDMSLELDYACVGILEATLKKLRISVDVSDHLSLPPLSKLKSLHITRGLTDVKNISEYDWLQNLISLEHLTFDALYSDFVWEIKTWFKDSLNCLPSLQKITFQSCDCLATLPDWICNLSSLKHIVVNDCYNLACLPERMPCLTNLLTLEVISCPLLFEECQRETSATQSRIAHIPNIILK